MKKLIYTAAIAAITMGMTACGGKSAEEKAMESIINSLDSTPAEEIVEYAEAESAKPALAEPALAEPSLADGAEETVSTDEEPAKMSADTDKSWFTDAELSEFKSKGKSGDIDKMLDAFEWINKVEASLKPQVRALDENAIKAKIELDKASEEICKKYDAYSMMGALNNMTDKMNSSQQSRYNSACSNSVLFFTINDDTKEYNSLYRKLRYGL